VLALLVLPVALIAGYSVFLLTNLTGVEHVFSWQAWWDFVPEASSLTRPWATDSPFWDTFVTSFAVTTLVAVATTLAAFPVAYHLAFVAGRRRYVLLLLLLAPYFTSQLLRLVAWQSILTEGGVLPSLLRELGLRDGGSIALLERSWSAVGLVLAVGWLPFVVLPMFAAMQAIDPRLLEAAQDLGASRLAAVRRVVLPLAMPGVVAGFLFVLIPTTGEFVTPQLVGGADTYTFGQAIQDLFVGTAIDWNAGAVLALWLMAIVVLLVATFARFLTADLRGARR
jgi:spermidine/putrescine transport system permease protein